jgi:hypothetical protein
MTGYEARKEPFKGIHDSLYAEVLCFRKGDKSMLILTADLIGYNKEFVEETKNLISQRTGIPQNNIMLTAVHNHGAPVTKAYEKDVPQAVDDYLKDLQNKLINIAETAFRKEVPFKMGIGKGNCTLNINRRAEFADGGIWLGRDQDKPCDHEIDVIRFEDMNDRLLAVFINWPCHGTASGQENYLITGDWPGACARFMKKQLGVSTIVAITAGASADINPIYGPGKDFNEIEAVGYHAGKAAWEAFQSIQMSPVNSLDAATELLKLPGKQQDPDQFPMKVYPRGPDVEISLSVFKIGNLVLAGISGELMNEIGVSIKKQSPYSSTVVITHCNGSSGYICTDKAFSEGGYEVKVSHLEPGAEKPLVKKILGMIENF